MAVVTAVVTFEVPEREGPGRYAEESEERWEMWIKLIGDTSAIGMAIKDCLEDEHTGICDWGTVSVQQITVT